MKNEKKITCIICPIGCKILVRIDGARFELVNGYKCRKGGEYVKNEALDPRRSLTTSVLVVNGEWPLVSVKTTEPIPKNKIFRVLTGIKKIKVKAPVKTGDVIIKNVATTRIDIIATKTVKKML